MDRVKRLRRVVLLCCHFARNLAYYKSGWEGKRLKVPNEFWVTVNGNFVDICVLEWCKLFGDDSDKHHWKQIVGDKDRFISEMLDKLKVSQYELEECWKSFRKYRDKFFAHLDSLEKMDIPYLHIAWDAVRFYHSHIVQLCSSEDLKGLPLDVSAYYDNCLADAGRIYEELNSRRHR